MISHEKFKFLISSIIVLSLIFYHLTNKLAASLQDDSFVIFKIAQFSVMMGFIFLAIYNNYLIKFILRKEYIAGNYLGESTYYIESSDINNATKEDIEHLNILKFSIKQNFFETTISGKSLKDSSIRATWYGYLFKVYDNTFYFALELTAGQGEFGTLKLTFDNQDVHGFYYSGDSSEKYPFKVSAKKVDED